MSTREGDDVSYIRSVNLALDDALDADPSVVIFGEDVGIPNGPFGATKGLAAKYGNDRVFDTPISESAMVGTALGAAMSGLRPVVEVMFADFLFVAMDQIVNQVANSRYVSGGKLGAPLVIRTQQGNTPGSCAQHSQSVEALLAHIPGLRVVLPASSQDAYGCLRYAINSDDPVIVIESRRLYPTKGPLDRSMDSAASEGASLKRHGDDVTIASWGAMLPDALAESERLAEIGISAEVIDLRWASPLDLDAVETSVRKTGRLVVAHEAVRTGGLGAEVVSQLHERIDSGFSHRRIGASYVPIPAAPALARQVIPGPDEVSAAVKELVS
jgi:pyruvate/2-oxoglutarate/acetoin dehydrogenase E1 component